MQTRPLRRFRDDSARRSATPARRRRQPDRPRRARDPRRGQRARRGGRRHVADRCAAVCAIGHGRLRGARGRHRRRHAHRRQVAAVDRRSLHGPDVVAHGRARDVRRNRDRGADARRRRRRGHGRRDREGGATARSGSSRPAYPRAAHRPPRRRYRRRRSRDLAGEARCSRAASARWRPSACADVEVFAQPRVAILSTGNEIVEPGQPLGPTARSTTSTASRLARSSRRTAASPSPGPPTPRRAHRRPRRVRETADIETSCFPGGSSVGERDLVVDAIPKTGRDDLSRHRGQAGQADRVREDRKAQDAVLRHARQPDVVPVERVHAARAVPARAGAACRRTRRAPSARRSAAASRRP